MRSKQAEQGHRRDSSGSAFAGSQRQLQLYVNEARETINSAIAAALSVSPSLNWVSPLKADRYAEYRDGAFLDALGLRKYKRELNAFWPTGGPVWDALALLRGPRPGVLLVEAKSHVPEMYGSGCKAVSPSSVRKIETALAQTKSWLGVPEEIVWFDSTRVCQNGPLYQTVNRLAHLYLLRQVLGLEAWLVNIYFIEDPHASTSLSEWQTGLKAVKKKLGLTTIPFVADVFLPASSRPSRTPV